MRVLALALVACGSAPPAEKPIPPAPPVADAAVVVPDADVPDAVTAAPAWVFRFASPERTETWTLRFADGKALLVVDNAQGPRRYVGTATEGTSLALAVTSANAKVALDCKRAKRAASTKCNDPKAKPIDVLDCYHPDFKDPMPFAPAPGMEYSADAGCKGYRLIAP